MVIHCGAFPKKDKNDQLSKLVIEVEFVHHHCKWFICLLMSSEGAQILWAASIFHNEVQVSTLLHPSMKQHNKSNLDSDYSSSSMLGGSFLGKPEKGQSCSTHRKMRLCSVNLPVPGLLSLCDSPVCPTVLAPAPSLWSVPSLFLPDPLQTKKLSWDPFLQDAELIINKFLLYIFRMKWREVAQSCLTLCDPMDRSLPGSSVPGILQARILESQSRDHT